MGYEQEGKGWSFYQYLMLAGTLMFLYQNLPNFTERIATLKKQLTDINARKSEIHSNRKNATKTFKDQLIKIETAPGTYVDVTYSHYMHYKNSDRSAYFEDYVTPEDSGIVLISRQITAGSRTKEVAAAKILKFVQDIPYDNSIEAKENYTRYPLETLIERNGDCEDKAILASSLMQAANIETILITLPGHVVIGVMGNFAGRSYTIEETNARPGKYFFAEATTPGFEIGQMPPEYQDFKLIFDPISGFEMMNE